MLGKIEEKKYYSMLMVVEDVLKAQKLKPDDISLLKSKCPDVYFDSTEFELRAEVNEIEEEQYINGELKKVWSITLYIGSPATGKYEVINEETCSYDDINTTMDHLFKDAIHYCNWFNILADIQESREELTRRLESLLHDFNGERHDE